MTSWDLSAVEQRERERPMIWTSSVCQSSRLTAVNHAAPLLCYQPHIGDLQDPPSGSGAPKPSKWLWTWSTCFLVPSQRVNFDDMTEKLHGSFNQNATLPSSTSAWVTTKCCSTDWPSTVNYWLLDFKWLHCVEALMPRTMKSCHSQSSKTTLIHNSLTEVPFKWFSTCLKVKVRPVLMELLSVKASLQQTGNGCNSYTFPADHALLSVKWLVIYCWVSGNIKTPNKRSVRRHIKSCFFPYNAQTSCLTCSIKDIMRSITKG